MSIRSVRNNLSATFLAVACTFVCHDAAATLVALGTPFAATQTVTFNEAPLGTSINGLSIDGFTFAESIPNAIVSTSGPGNTNHVTQPSAIGAGNPANEVTTIALASAAGAFEFDYALLSQGIVTDGVIVTLFDGATNLGSLSYTGTPDPSFPGGYAGIASTIPFDRVQLTFSTAATAYAFDNVAALPASVPEPATAGLAGIGLVGLALVRRRRNAPR